MIATRSHANNGAGTGAEVPTNHRRWLISQLFCTTLFACLSGSLLFHEHPQGVAADKPKAAMPAKGKPKEKEKNVPDPAAALYAKYPDVPRVPILAEVDGIEIPRLKAPLVHRELGGKIPVDADNELAKQKPTTPVTGGTIVVRLNSEPQSLNPIVETSAVQQYMLEYMADALAKQNPESLKYEPKLATKWVAEDSIKLSADYPGKERRVSLGKGTAAATWDATYPELKTEAEKKTPPVLEFFTTDKAGKPVGQVWVGLFPAEPAKMSGAPTTGYHDWSDSTGKVSFSELVAGKYIVKVGAEVYGVAKQNADGSLTVTSGTDENPLKQELAATGKPSLDLKKGEWSDLQQEVYYTYYLREEAKWADSTPYTSKDLEFAYRVINNPFVDGESLRVYYKDLVECQPIGPHVIRMKYRQQYFKAFEFTAQLAQQGPPWHLFQQMFREDKDGAKELTLESLTPEEEQAQQKVSVNGQVFGKFFNTDSRYNQAPLGVGPYVLNEKSWDRGNGITFVRNEKYWDKQDRGYVNKIVFRFVKDNVTALQALKAGEIDFCYMLTAEQFYEDLQGPPDWLKKNFVKSAWYTPAYSYVGWNLLKPQFQDRRVRLALRLLFNVQEFVDKKLHGGAIPIAASEYVFGLGHDHSLRPIGYSPEAAADLLAEAGWSDSNNDGVLDKNGKRLSFTMTMPPGNKTIEDQAAMMQKAFKEAGIEMEIKFLEWASYIDRIKAKDFEVCRLSWAMNLENDPFQLWHGSGAGVDKRGSNHCSFNNPLANQLIEMLRVTLNEEKRQLIHYSLERLLDSEQPYLFLYAPKDFGVYHNRYRGVKWSPLRPGFDLREWYVPKELQ